MTATIYRRADEDVLARVRAARRALGLPMGAPPAVVFPRTQEAGNGRG
jgi:hypothetical protein